MRGGGGNFGVVTDFAYRLHSFGPNVLAGTVVSHSTWARQVLTALMEFTEHAPDEMYLNPLILKDAGGRAVGFEVCYCGPPAEGERLLAPLRKLGKVLADDVSIRTYLDAQGTFDPGLPAGRNYYFKSGFLSNVTATMVDEMVELFREAPPSLMDVPIIHLGGAAGRISPDATAFWNRAAQHDLAVWATWGNNADTARTVAEIRGFWRKLEHLTKGYYINTDVPDDENRLRETYGGNYRAARADQEPVRSPEPLQAERQHKTDGLTAKELSRHADAAFRFRWRGDTLRPSAAPCAPPCASPAQPKIHENGSRDWIRSSPLPSRLRHRADIWCSCAPARARYTPVCWPKTRPALGLRSQLTGIRARRPTMLPSSTCTGGVNKFDGFLEFWRTDSRSRNYRYYLLLDDDVIFEPGDISRLFELSERHSTALSQPALKWSTYYNLNVTLANSACEIRSVSFVEVMAACFSAATLEQMLPTFSLSLSTWGIDWAWACLLKGAGKLHVVDAVTIEHTKPVDVKSGALYRMLKARGVD
ncbi:MAG: hypothetical protein WDO56_20950 [Gammaproteobacteria bacterium]